MPRLQLSRVVLIALALWGGTAIEAASETRDTLLVFDHSAPNITVFDATSLDRLGAITLDEPPTSAAATSAGNLVVAMGRNLALYDRTLEHQRVLRFDSPIADGKRAILAARGNLFVALGDQIVVVDEHSMNVVTRLNVGFAVGSLVNLPEQGRALAIGDRVAVGIYFDTEKIAVSGAPFRLPAATTGISTSATANPLAVADNAVYDLSQLQPSFGGAAASNQKTAASIERIGPDRFLLQRDSDLHLGSTIDPSKLAHIASDVRDIAANDQSGFALVGSDVIQIDSFGRTLNTAAASATASRLVLIPASKEARTESPQQVEQFTGQLTQNFGDGQIVTPGQSFLIGVLAVDEDGQPQQNLAVFVSAVFPSPTAASCAQAVTDLNGQATLTCSAGTSIFGSVIQLTVEDSLGRKVSFGMSVSTTTLTDGLNKLTGDLAFIPRNTQFNLTVQALDNGSPQPNLPLTITRIPNDSTATCPAVAFTASDGIATIPCIAGSVLSPRALQVTVSDSFGRFANFTVTIIPESSAPSGVSIVSGDNQVVPRNSAFPLPLVTKYQVGEIPQVGAQLLVATDAPSILFCPAFVFTGSDGIASIFCAAGNVETQTTAHIFITAPDSSTLPEPFEVTIVLEPQSAATRLTLLSASVLQGQSGETLADAVRLLATDDEGLRIAGATIIYGSTDNITVSPGVGITAFDGETEASLTLGCPANTGSFVSRLQSGGNTITVPVVISAGTARLMEKTQGDGQSGSAGELLRDQALVVRVTDPCGIGVSGVPVSWSVSPSSAATLQNTVGLTDGQGRSSTLVRLGTRPGPFTVTARSGQLSQTFAITTTATPGSIITVSGDGQSVAAGETAAGNLVAEVQSTQGASLPGIDVSFSITSGTGTLSSVTAITDSQGRASTAYTAGQTSGDVVVTARLVSLPAITTQFRLRVTGSIPDVTALSFVNGATFLPGWVPGSTGVIFGPGIVDGFNGVLTAGPAPFPVELRGVRVTVNGIRAPILGLANVNGQEQINIQVPFEIRAPSRATVVLENNGAVVSIPGVDILAAQPGIFEFPFNGQQYAAALHTDFSPVTPLNPARRGETILLFLTGLGPLNPTVPTNVAGPVPPAEALFGVAVGIDHVGMVNSGAFYAPGLLTAFQINFVVGDSVAIGTRTLNVVAQGVSSQEVQFPVGP